MDHTLRHNNNIIVELLSLENTLNLNYQITKDLLYSIATIIVKLKKLHCYTPDQIKGRVYNASITLARQEKADFDGDLEETLRLIIDSLWRILQYDRVQYTIR